MRRLSVAVAVALCASALSAQKPGASPDQAEKQSAPCRVSGRVVNATEGAPIKSAQVVLEQENAKRKAGVFGATTDQDGRFEIKSVPPGRYRFFAAHAGFISQQYQAKATESGALLSLAPGQEVTDVLFRLVRAAVITGHVTDESGEPMLSVSVSVLRKLTADEKEDWGQRGKKDRLFASATAITDDRGDYRLFGLKPGEYYVKAADTSNPPYYSDQDPLWMVRRALGNSYAPLYYPGVIQLGQAETVKLRAGEEMQADFEMRHIKTVEVSGRVVAADGGPATHTYVQLLTPDEDDWSDELGSSTDSKGEFSIKGVPPGSYVLSAQQHDQEKRYMTRMKLDVGNEKVDSLTISFGRGTTISGRIVLADSRATGVDRMHVSLSSVSEDDDMAGFAWAEVKKDGTFQIADVADGRYSLHVMGMEQGWFVKSARLGGEDVTQRGVQVERGNSGGSLEVVLSSASAQLDGSVTDHDKPVVGAQVRARPDPVTPYNRHRSRSATTDQNGQFAFDDLPPGKYRVLAKLPSAAPEVPPVSSEPQVVTLSEHDHQSVKFVLEASTPE